MKLTLLAVLTLLTSSIYSQHILQRENGVIYNGSVLITPPYLLGGFGSAANGMYGDSLSYFYEEQNDSYNGTDLVGSSWMSYGDLLPKKLPEIVSIGLGFDPDTFKWEFTIDSIFVSVLDAETPNFSNYRFEYLHINGTGNGIDSLHIHDDILIEPSLVKVYANKTLVSIQDKSYIDNLSVYPNPCSEKIQIKLPEDLKIQKITLQDIRGEICKEFHQVDADNNLLNLANLNSGIYILTIQTTNKEFLYEKIIIK